MRQQESTSLYIFIGLLILVGLILFLFKDNISDQLLNYNTGTQVTTAVKNNTELKLDVLKDARIKALKNYVSIFDYNNLDKSQAAILAEASKQDEVVISNPDETATSTKSDLIRVRVGNSNPFLVKKAAK
jgi:hypothetical protein